jgi:hypothetical protein
MRRDRAILRGLKFIYRTACDAENFSAYGYDYVFCLHWICSTARDDVLRSTAHRMAVECAWRWRAAHPTVAEEADADTVTHMVFGGLAADKLGVHDAKFKPQVRKAAGHLSAHDFIWFDPLTEQPPDNVPEECDCGAANSRGAVTCHRCQSPLNAMSSYEVWLLGLIRSYLGERYGVTLGAKYGDVLRWLPSLRPYPGADAGDDYVWSLYAVTHVVYTLNGYSSYKLSPSWLPDEYEFLKSSLDKFIAWLDPDGVGEILDSLKSFGLQERDPLIRRGVDFLLSTQNPDGSWGEVDATDIYDRYHPTLTAINGLRDYAWRETRLISPRFAPMLRHWAIS